MKTFSAEYLQRIGRDIFMACGAPSEEAGIVAGELVEASLLGLDSHGIIRYAQYAEAALCGTIKPGAEVRVLKETPTTAIVDCGLNFGPVSAVRMVEIVCDKAGKSGIACVVSRNSHHIGRLGSYVQKIADRGMFGLATCNSSKHGHWVVPWGGREGRLATNPLAYAAPTSGLPVVMDMSTSMISEGEVRVLMHQGKPVPPGRIQDAYGNPVSDPRAFYGPPHGSILPLGSELGYKGFGLALLVEIMSGIMAGMATSADNGYVNGLSLTAVNTDFMCGASRFRELMDDLSSYMTTTPPAPGHKDVVMPGAYDFQMREKRLVEGIPVDEHTWSLIVEVARRVGLDVPVDGEESQIPVPQRSEEAKAEPVRW